MSAATQETNSRLSTYPLLGVGGVLLGAMIATFLGRLLSVGAGDLRGALNLDFDEASWLSTSYSMGLMFVGPFSVYLGGLLGARRVLLVCAAAFSVICVVLPLAVHVPVLITLLAFGGLTAGTFYPLTLSVVLRNLPPRYLLFGIGAYAADIVVTTHVAHSYEAWLMNSVKAASALEQESTSAVAEGKSLEVAQLESHAALLDQEQAVLTQQLASDDLTMQFDDVLGLALGTKLILDPDSFGEKPTLLSRQEAALVVKDKNPKVLAARQTVEKAKAGVSAAKDNYIPDITGVARYSYQSGVPFLVHNFGTFGGIVSYDLFDGGAREAKLKQARIELHIAELLLAQAEADVEVEVSAVYDRVERVEQLVSVASESLKVRQEAARLSEQKLQQNAALASDVSKAAAGVYAAKASVLDAQLNLFLVQNQIKQLLGERPN